MALTALSEPPEAADTLALRLEAIRHGAEEILLFELARPNGSLPPAGPGSHVDLHLPDGLIRQYSLITPLCTPKRYVVAVKREAEGRGGSRWLHENARIGAWLTVGLPRNTFELDELAEDTVLLAGGIGITPIYSMFRHLQAAGRRVTLHCWARSPQHLLFRDELERTEGVFLHYSGPARGSVADALESASAQAHVYCCGPARMIGDVVAHIGQGPRLHVERFSQPEMESSPDAAGGFTVHLARRNCDVIVPPGTSILAALVEAGIDVSYSCEEGLCGACETKFVDGDPIHRDSVRSPEEHARRGTVMICCALSRSPRLVLDI